MTTRTITMQSPRDMRVRAIRREIKVLLRRHRQQRLRDVFTARWWVRCWRRALAWASLWAAVIILAGLSVL